VVFVLSWRPLSLSSTHGVGRFRCRVLLDFLGRQADSRLQAQFEDTRIDLAAASRKLAPRHAGLIGTS